MKWFNVIVGAVFIILLITSCGQTSADRIKEESVPQVNQTPMPTQTHQDFTVETFQIWQGEYSYINVYRITDKKNNIVCYRMDTLVCLKLEEKEK